METNKTELTVSNKYGVIGMICSFASYFSVLFATIASGAASYVGFTCASASVICGAIIAVVGGTRAIKAFNIARRTSQKKPIPGFVMGLVGLGLLPTITINWLAAIAAWGVM